MCGRFLLTSPPEALRQIFGFLEHPNLEPRFNVAPSQPVAAMLRDAAAERHFVWLRWGLLPAWSRGREAGRQESGRREAGRQESGRRDGGRRESGGGGRPAVPLINARAETVAEKPSFRDAFAARRCVVFADGFYEWRQSGNRQPYCVRLSDTSPFALAAIWEPVGAAKDGGPAQGCALLTTQANARMAEVHHRMPVILTPQQVGPWLDPTSTPDELQALLKPLPDDAVTLTPVSKRVNSVREDDADLLREERLPEAPSQLDLF